MLGASASPTDQMKPEPNVEAIFHAARELRTGPERDRYLDNVFGQSENGTAAKKRKRVEKLLRAEREAGRDFLEGSRSQGSSLADLRPTAGQPPPRTLGPYRILDVLGHGAQATVYLAEHESLGRRVALKVLHPSMLGASTSARQRFRREAEVTANLEHANICSVYETGDSDGTTWIAMQLVSGRTLAEHLTQAAEATEQPTALQLPETTAATNDNDLADGKVGTSRTGSAGRSDVMRIVKLLEQAARALHAAHERGLVHRDIKPGNLMVTDEGQPVLLDFGIARAGDDDSDGPGLTRTTDVLGTPHYMAPEQLRATSTVDRRADIYALGVTLFECLTGQRPFQAPSREALYQQILTAEPPAPRSLNAQIPRDLEVVALTALDKDRDRRYRTAADFAEDLRRVRHYEPIHARPISPLGRLLRWARRAPLLAASLTLTLVSLIAGVGVSLWSLKNAEMALLREQQARTAWYEDLSRELAAQDLRGEFTLLQAQLENTALSLIASDVPEFPELYDEVTRQHAFGPHYPVELPYQCGMLLGSLRGRLVHARGACASDWFHLQCRRLMSELTSGRRSDRLERGLVEFARWSLDALDDLDGEDLRVVRARAMLLDALFDHAEYDQVAMLARQFLDADARAMLPPDQAREALWRSRIGAAQLARGEVTAARELLVDTAAPVSAEFPGTWLAFRAQAFELQLYDALEDGVKQRPLRASLCNGIARATNYMHTTLSHWFSHPAMVAVGPTRQAFWMLMEESFVNACQRRVERDELDQYIARFEDLRDEHSVAIDDPVHGVLFVMFTAIGANQERFHGPGNSVGTRAYEFAAQLAAPLPDAQASEAYLDTLTLLARYLRIRGDLNGAEEKLQQALALPQARTAGPMRAFVQSQLGWCRLARGDYEQAAELLRKAFAIDRIWAGVSPTIAADSSQALIQLYRAWGRVDDAVRVHRLRRELWPELSSNHQLVLTLMSFARHQAAEREYRAIADRGELTPRTAYFGTSLALRRGDTPQAMARAKNARGHWGSAALARLLAASGDHEGAIVHFEATAERLLHFVNGDGFWLDYGLTLVALNRTDDALSLLDRLVARRPSDPLRHAARARFLATAAGLTPAHRAEALAAARHAHELAGGRRAHLLALVAEAQAQSGDRAAAATTMRDVLALMNGRDAQWLRLADARARLASYESR